MRTCPPIVLALLFCLVQLSGADQVTPNRADFHAHVQPFLTTYCYDCHGPKRQKAGLDLSEWSDGNILAADDAAMWREVVDRLNTGDMPPAKSPQPKSKELLSAIAWITAELKKAAAKKKAAGSDIVLRRLNHVEYRNTLRDLTGHPYDPTLRFLDDTKVHGFDNVGTGLQLSALQMQQYLVSAERLVDKILTTPKQQPARHHWRIIPVLGKPTERLRGKGGAWYDGLHGKKRDRIKDGRVPIPRKYGITKDQVLRGYTDQVRGNAEIPHGNQPYRLVDLSAAEPKHWEGFADLRCFGGTSKNDKSGNSNFGFKWFLYDEGVYRVTLKLRAYADQSVSWAKPPKITVYRYPEEDIVGEYFVPPDRDTTLTFTYYRDDPRHYFRQSGTRYWGMMFRFKSGHRFERDTSLPKGKDGRHPWQKRGHLFGVTIKSIDIEGPVHASWPPPWVTTMVPELWSFSEPDAEPVLQGIAERAWRRPLSQAERLQLLNLFKAERKQGVSLVDALRLPLTTILTSPHFLCLVERKPTTADGRLSAHELAARLSYFLWRSMPDAELRQVADDGSLLQDVILRQQVQRMLHDRRIDALTDGFPVRWLDLDKLRGIEPDRRHFPSWDQALAFAAAAETPAMFKEIFNKDMSVVNFLDSDWAMLNDRLAMHYGISGVEGHQLRRVALPPGHQRGGLLAHSSILTLTSNGVRTLPITRGAYILERLLADPPPEPPPNVSQLENTKEPRPNATLRELLEVHRDNPSCSACHVKIDPLGFALEHYDATGAFRTHEIKFIKGKRTQTHAVDVRGALPDGRAFVGLPGLKKLLVDDADKFRACLAEKMLIYALGREVNFTDHQVIRQLVDEFKNNGDSLKALVTAIALSNTFRQR